MFTAHTQNKQEGSKGEGSGAAIAQNTQQNLQSSTKVEAEGSTIVAVEPIVEQKAGSILTNSSAQSAEGETTPEVEQDGLSTTSFVIVSPQERAVSTDSAVEEAKDGSTVGLVSNLNHSQTGDDTAEHNKTITTASATVNDDDYSEEHLYKLTKARLGKNVIECLEEFEILNMKLCTGGYTISEAPGVRARVIQLLKEITTKPNKLCADDPLIESPTEWREMMAEYLDIKQIGENPLFYLPRIILACQAGYKSAYEAEGEIYLPHLGGTVMQVLENNGLLGELGGGEVNE